MSISISDFISSLGRRVRGFPPTLRRTYAEMIANFRSNPSSQGFDQMNSGDGFTDPTPRGVANRMYWWFPTHFFKFQDALLKWESRCRKSKEIFLLDRPKVTFVDLGCGAGAASAALLATLEQYQMYRRTNNAPLSYVEVNLIALDPVPDELRMYEALITAYASRLREACITVSTVTICQPFPEGTPQLIATLSLLRGHVLIVGMSNLINWIWNDWDQSWKAKDSSAVEKLKPAEAEALQKLATHTDFDNFHVIGIATKTRKIPFLPDKLSALILKAIETFKREGRLSGKRWYSHAQVLFENPEGSRWAADRPQATAQYFVENVMNVSPAYDRDTNLRDAVSIRSLERAWVKVRSYARYESIMDQVEHKLFEVELGTNLAQLQVHCLDREHRHLHVNCDMPYEFPKDDKQTRPRSLARLEEQVVAASICMHFADMLQGPCPEVSYSYRLASSQSEFLYEYWFDLYRLYLSDVLKRLGNQDICSVDIKSFYIHIQQATLLDALCERLKDSARCHELLAATIERDCHHPHAAGYGLIQGHTLSGLLANIMLQSVDDRLVHHRGLRDRYARFTDDITIIGSVKSQDADVEAIRQELRNLDPAFELNGNKTNHYDSRSYRKKVRGSAQLDGIAARFRAVILPLYVTNSSYRSEFHRLQWQFVHQYQYLLETIGIHFSPEWLYRKLDEYSTFSRFVTALRRRWYLRWPEPSLMSSVSTWPRWKEKFEQQNAQWMKEKSILKRELSILLSNSVRYLLGGSPTDEHHAQWKRILKFALYRLNVFGTEDVTAEITQLTISKPWDIPIQFACQALARAQQERSLRQIVNESRLGYVSATALRALGKIRTDDNVSLLASVLDSETSPIEKLMASEALLDANMWRGIEFDRVKHWLDCATDQPYIQKNIVLLMSQAYPHEAKDVLQHLDVQVSHQVVRRAIHYALTKPPSENLLWRAEPEVVRKYRAKSYPFIEELLSDQGSYAIVS